MELTKKVGWEGDVREGRLLAACLMILAMIATI
jgi:hypothetical protein